MSSSTFSDASAAPQHAITDVYDEKRRTFLIQYPVPLVVALSIAGILAFAVAGFLGFRKPGPTAGVTFQPLPLDGFFREPWPLFLWFCGLIMALEISILRDRRLRGQMVAALVVTVISMILVGIFYFYGFDVQNLLRRLLDITTVLPEIGDSPYTYALINFGILAIFWLDTLRRWVRVASGKPLTRGVDIGVEEDAQSNDDQHPSLDELISGDLIAAAALALVLALVFRAGVINFISDALRINVNVNTCTVSWPFGACTKHLGSFGGTSQDPPTLFFMDLLQSLIYLPLGLLILALSATVAGLGAAGGVEESANRGRAGTSWAGSAQTATGSVSEQVTMTLFDTLRTALNRRLRFAAGNFTLSLRNAIWPALVFVSTLSVAAASRAVQNYLHLLSVEKTCGQPGYLPCDYVDSQLLTNGQPYTSIAIALVLGGVSVLAVTLAMALFIYRARVAENTLRFLGLIGLIVLLTFWLFSLTLSAFNGLLWLLDNNVRVPFPQPGVTTIVSFVCLVGYGAYFLVFRRGRGTQAAASVTSTTRSIGDR
jgi:hypothetical protein